MDSIHLLGAEDVRSAANSMRSAADSMQSAASTISNAVDQFGRQFYDHISQLQCFVDEAQKIAVRNDRVQRAWVHLSVAISQSLPTDDQTIMNHVREACSLLDPKYTPPATEPASAPAPKPPSCKKKIECDAPDGHDGECNDNNLPF